MNKNHHRTSSTSTKHKLPLSILIAIIGCAGVIVAAVIGVLGALITAYFSYMASRLPINATQTAEAKLIATPTLNANLSSIPTAGAQLDFSPHLSLGENPDDIPKNYGLLSSPFSGIFVSELQLQPHAPSWEVYYFDGTDIPAQSETCLINEGYPETLQSPLNMKVSDIEFMVSVYTDSRYSMTLTGIEIIVTNYLPPRTDIDYVEVRQPGAGGMGLPFQTVRTERTLIDRDSLKNYQIDFLDFTLKPYQGVNLLVPVFLASDGTYQFQVKVNGIATPTNSSDSSGNLTLTTGRVSYGWAKIHDPRQYKVKQDESISFGDSSKYGPVNLVPCP